MKIALLGAGHIGSTIGRLLHDCGDYDIVVADRDAELLAALHPFGIETRLLDSHDAQALHAFVAGRDGIVNALPYHMAVPVATVARDAGAHYFDLTEDVHATKAIQASASGATTAFMPQCGLAPGFAGIAAHALCNGFDTVYDVKIRVGALPQFPTNALKYNLTWSVDGLINEYCHPCEAIRDGHRREVEPLEGLEHFSLDGVEYEAFNTSGGLGTLCETLKDTVRNLDYKSVRYPGHCALMRFLLEELQFARRQDQLKEIMRVAVPNTMQDVVLVFVTVSGLRNRHLVQKVFTRKIFASTGQGGQPLSAIQITTAAAVCAALDLFREGRLPRRGFIPQERIALDAFLDNRFGRVYNTAAD